MIHERVLNFLIPGTRWEAGGKLHAPAALPWRKTALITYWGRASTRAGVANLEEIKTPYLCHESNHDSLVVQTMA
jgi:hypothetical protein